MMTNTNSNQRVRIKTEYRENKLPARLLSVGEVAHFLGVHSSTVRRWEKGGLLKSYTIGLRRNLRFKQEDVLKFIGKSKGFKQDVLDFLDKCQGESAHGISLRGSLDKGKHRIEAERR